MHYDDDNMHHARCMHARPPAGRSTLISHQLKANYKHEYALNPGQKRLSANAVVVGS
jgi:hypothetical protein